MSSRRLSADLAICRATLACSDSGPCSGMSAKYFSTSPLRSSAARTFSPGRVVTRHAFAPGEEVQRRATVGDRLVRILARIEHARQIENRRIGIATTHRLDECRDCIVVVLSALVIPKTGSLLSSLNNLACHRFIELRGNLETAQRHSGVTSR